MNTRTMVAMAMLALTAAFSIATAADDEDVLRPHGSKTERNTGSNSSSRISKSTVIFGIEGGINYSMFSQTMNRTGAALADSPENVLESGDGISPYFGIMADFPIVSSVGIQLRALYDPKKVSNTFNGTVDATTNTIPPRITDMPTTSEFTLTMDNLSIAAALRVDLTPSVFITAGPMAQFTLGDVKRKDIWSSAKPDTFTININYEGKLGPNTSISRETTSATNFMPNIPPNTPNASPFKKVRIGLEVGLGGKIDIGSNLWLVPQVRYQYMFTPLNDNFKANDLSRTLTNQQSVIEFSNPKLHSLQIGLGLWFGI